MHTLAYITQCMVTCLQYILADIIPEHVYLTSIITEGSAIFLSTEELIASFSWDEKIFFIFDHTKLQDDSADLNDAIVFFTPTSVSVEGPQ